MYPEFIPIYIGLIVIIALLVTILILVLKRSNNSVSVPKNTSTASNPATTEAGTIVFCKNCATQFNSNQKCCPKCGAPRWNIRIFR